MTQLFPFTIWISGIKLESSGLGTIALTHGAISLAQAQFFSPHTAQMSAYIKWFFVYIGVDIFWQQTGFIITALHKHAFQTAPPYLVFILFSNMICDFAIVPQQEAKSNFLPCQSGLASGCMLQDSLLEFSCLPHKTFIFYYIQLVWESQRGGSNWQYQGNMAFSSARWPDMQMKKAILNSNLSYHVSYPSFGSRSLENKIINELGNNSPWASHLSKHLISQRYWLL